MKVLVVHAGRRCGALVDASPATEGLRLDPYDAIVVGSATDGTMQSIVEKWGMTDAVELLE